MRFYAFTNMYLSSLQVGLQTAHVLAEMYEKYRGRREAMLQIKEWARNHKTIIILNAGYSSNIRKLVDFFKRAESSSYPWAKFNEDEDALDGALTVAGIILPEKIYAAASQEPLLLPNPTLTPWELQLIEQLGQYRLAR